ncbi:MAG TPA: hypothetical protein P5550_04615 [Bacteroidales bacterium]|nr:hypothetical protein [Bacteroidales bacterium]HRZ76310.1 hypothetical protein [Bacteroidales bacterium]
MSTRTVKLLLLPVLVLTTLVSHAQVRIGSPYSRFGIGDLSRLTNARNLSMGGASLALRDPVGINYLNPASYTAFDTLSFVFEGGVANHLATTRTTDLSATQNYISMGYLLFGFPLSKWWKASFGLLPFSDVGYNIMDSEVHPEAGPLTYLFKGSGGINQIYFGSAFRITPRLSAGFNIAYLFGTLDKSRAVYFSDTSNSMNLRFSNRTTYGDFLPSFGLQYHTEMGKDHFLVLAATYGPQSSLEVTDDQLAETFTTGATGIDFVKDTITDERGRKGQVVFPSGYGFGFSLGRSNVWQAVAEVRMQNWEDYRYFDIRDSLRNSYQISTGFSYIPDHTSVSGYWDKVTYRAGIRYGSTYLQLRENHLSDLGISFGLGLPLRRSRSVVNVGFEYGRRGTTAADLIQENYFRVVLGVSVYERWFLQRRYE